jgi:hypothetical protein
VYPAIFVKTKKPKQLNQKVKKTFQHKHNDTHAYNALGATFSFITWYYCNVLFVALQDTKQVIIKLQLKQFRENKLS